MTASVEFESASIVPFWNRIPEMLRYPLHGSALVTIIILGMARVLGLMPLGFVWVLLITVAMYRYAFDCLLATADGRPDPPEASITDDSGLGWRLIGLIIILIVFIDLCAYFLGRGPGIVVAVLIGFALPGAIITLAMEQSVLRALNPGKWLAVITRIGWPYLAAVGLCLVVLFSQRYAEAFVARIMAKVLAIMLMGIIANYALVVTFHLMGYLVYQFHDALGVASSGPESYAPLRDPDPDQDVLDESAELVKGGDPDEATALLRNHLRGRGGTPKVHDAYRKLLHLADDKPALLAHGHEYLAMLLAQGKDQAALKVFYECRTIDPQFALADPAQITRLAQRAAQSGQPQLALQLVSGFRHRFPASPDIAQNEFLAATIVHEHMNQDEKAREMLLDLKAQYPASPLMAKIDARLALIDKMSQAAHDLGARHPGGGPHRSTTSSTD